MQLFIAAGRAGGEFAVSTAQSGKRLQLAQMQCARHATFGP